MGARWHEVFSQETAFDRSTEHGPPRLADLLDADGYNTGHGDVETGDWVAFSDRLYQQFGLAEGDSLYDVGCGAGAFLLPAYERGIQVGGLDFSATLLDLARRAMPDGEFRLAEAAALEAEPTADVVVSMGVIFYFDSYDYVDRVLATMCAKATRAVGLFDLPDAELAEEAMAERQRIAGGAEAYAKRYKGLEHLTFTKEWIERRLRDHGLRDIVVEPQSLSGYGNGKYRFNAWGWKTDPS